MEQHPIKLLKLLKRIYQLNFEIKKSKDDIRQVKQTFKERINEAKEETGLDLTLNDKFEYSYSYTFNDFKGNKIEKTVIFFIGIAEQESIVTLSYEHIDYLWLPYEQARMQIHFESVRKLIDEVEIFLNKEYKS